MRFPAPVFAGSRVRLRMKLAAVRKHRSGTLVSLEQTREIEGEPKPAMVAVRHLLAVA